MAKTLGTGAALLNIRFQIGSDRVITFDFGTDLSGWTFEFFVKQNKGARLKDISLTIGSGISMPIYGSESIDVSFSGSDTNITEGEYYWELRRTDLNVPLINGLAYFSFDAPDGDESVPLSITIGNDSINVTVSSISSGNSHDKGFYDISVGVYPSTIGLVKEDFYDISVGGFVGENYIPQQSVITWKGTYWKTT
jgi:hypothetical protein